MLVAIGMFVVVAALALGVVAVFLNGGRSFDENGRWMKESFHAWRHGELDDRAYEVKLEDTAAHDVFTSFEQADGQGYVSMGEVSAAFKPVAHSLESVADSLKHVGGHSKTHTPVA